MDKANVTYRQATIGDKYSITELFRTTIQRVNVNHYSPQEIAAWSAGSESHDRWIDRINNHHFILSHDRDTLTGMASIDHLGYLDIIYVHHQYQGLGLASELLHQMETRCRALGHEEITSDVSITAKPFFLHKGFEIVRPQLVLCRGVVLRNYAVRKEV